MEPTGPVAYDNCVGVPFFRLLTMFKMDILYKYIYLCSPKQDRQVEVDVVHYLLANELFFMLEEHMLFVSVGIKMILRYNSNAFYSIESIFLLTLIFYLFIDIESNHVKRY